MSENLEKFDTLWEAIKSDLPPHEPGKSYTVQVHDGCWTSSYYYSGLGDRIVLLSASLKKENQLNGEVPNEG